jgi:beta-lactamase class C
MTQDLVWQQYPYPVEFRALLAGNSAEMSFEANPATAPDPPLAPLDRAFLNKTGSTNGFAAHAFVTGENIGVVLLADKSYPIDARATAAYNILMHLGDGSKIASVEAAALKAKSSQPGTIALPSHVRAPHGCRSA